MPGIARPGGVGLRHEGGRATLAGGDRLDRLLHQEGLVGRAQRLVVAEVELVLAGTRLAVQRLELEARCLERLDVAREQVAVLRDPQPAVGVRPRVVDLHREREAGARDIGERLLDQIELPLESDLDHQAAVTRCLQHPLQARTRAERQRRAVEVVPVADDEALAVQPRHRAVGVGVRPEVVVGEAGRLRRERAGVAGRRLDQILGDRVRPEDVRERHAVPALGRHRVGDRHALAAPGPHEVDAHAGHVGGARLADRALEVRHRLLQV